MKVILAGLATKNLLRKLWKPCHVLIHMLEILLSISS